MAVWEDRVKSHQFNATLSSIKQILSTIEERSSNLSGDALTDFHRVRDVVALFEAKMSRMDVQYVHNQFLSNIQPPMQEIVNQLNAFSSSNNADQIRNAAHQCDNVLNCLGTLPEVVSTSDIGDMREAATSYRRSAGKLISSIQAEKSQLSSRIAELGAQIEVMTRELEAQKSRVDSLIPTLQGQFSDAETKRSESFAASQKQREEAFGATSSDLETKVDHIFELLDQRIGNEVGSLHESGQQVLAHLNESRKKAEEILTIVTNSGLAGGYQAEANQNRKDKRFWQVTTVLSFLGMILLAVVQLNSGGTNDVGHFAARVFAAVTFAILGAYAALQAERQGQLEKTNRRIELSLKAIGPYIKDFTEEKKQQLREKLAEEIFTKSEPVVAANDHRTTGSVLDVIQQLSELVKQIRN